MLNKAVVSLCLATVIGFWPKIVSSHGKDVKDLKHYYIKLGSINGNTWLNCPQKMFTRMNKKLGEHILHFLFVCIDRDKASKVFRDCWPLLDKRQESQFYKATFEWYKSLQQVRCSEVLMLIYFVFSDGISVDIEKFLSLGDVQH